MGGPLPVSPEPTRRDPTMRCRRYSSSSICCRPPSQCLANSGRSAADRTAGGYPMAVPSARESRRRCGSVECTEQRPYRCVKRLQCPSPAIPGLRCVPAATVTAPAVSQLVSTANVWLEPALPSRLAHRRRAVEPPSERSALAARESRSANELARRTARCGHEGLVGG